MNQMQAAVLKGLGYTHDETIQRDGQWIAIAVKPRPDGNGNWRAEAPGRTPDDANEALVRVLTRR